MKFLFCRFGWVVFLIVATGQLGACGKAKAVTGGATCTGNNDCASGSLCLGGKCTDAASLCSATQPCGGDLVCVNGLCPSRCDAASGGAGCRTFTCTASGTCAPAQSSQRVACSNASPCANGFSCISGFCPARCDSPGATCLRGTCNSGGTCDLSPLSTPTPFVSCRDSTTKCPTSTPYCNDDGTCAAAPTSSAACALFDKQSPTLVAGKCGCDSTSTCESGFACASAEKCGTSCTPKMPMGCPAGKVCSADGTFCFAPLANGLSCNFDAQCQSTFCECGDAKCMTTKCAPAKCAACKYLNPDATDCSIPSERLSKYPTCPSGSACNGSGACTKGGFVECNSDSECLSASCNYFIPGGPKVCVVPPP